MAKEKNTKLIGQKFGRLTVISKAPSIPGGQTIKRLWGAWNCQCDCGNFIVAKTMHLNRGGIKSCGCIISKYGVKYKPGQKFHRLTTISYNKGKWICKCDCGNYVTVPTIVLTNENTKSCGCLKTEKSSQNAMKMIETRRKFDPKTASARRVWKRYCYRDKQCDLKFEEFLFLSQQNCFYCDILPTNTFNYFDADSSKSSVKAKMDGLFIYNGLDRINSNLPHTINNVVPACYDCNRAKSDRLIDEFLLWINKLKIKDFQSICFVGIPLPTNKSLATSIRCIFYNIKNDTNMTVEEYYTISQMNCFYCDSELSNCFNRAKSDKKSSQKAKDNGNFRYNGVDRIDRNFPHDKNNVVPCCHYCNYAKQKLTLSEFNIWIKRIKTYQASKNLILT
jgi:5-methylcytosine-specific restriction endonuclease McrA